MVLFLTKDTGKQETIQAVRARTIPILNCDCSGIVDTNELSTVESKVWHRQRKPIEHPQASGLTWVTLSKTESLPSY